MQPLNPNNDNELLISLKQGDVNAFDILYYRYAKKLMAFALTFFADKVIAEEAVQEIFLRIWEKRQTLDATKPFKSYLFQAVKFYMFNYIRNKKASCAYEEVAEGEFSCSSVVEENMHYDELEATANRVIEKLPLMQQQIFRLNKLEGLTPQQIANRLNLSKRTIEHHIYLATKTVKAELMHHMSLSVMVFVGLFF